MIKTDVGRLIYKYMYLSLYCKGSKRLLKVCVWEGVGDRTEIAIFWPELLWPSTLCLSRSPGLLNRRPRGPLCWVMAFFTASYQHLLWTPTHQGPKAPLAWCGFPYHISSITPSPTVTATYQGPQGPFGLMWLYLPHLILLRLQLYCNWLTSVLTELYNSSTPTQSPTRFLESHQAEISIMQFTGHCLPVHQSMSVPLIFFTSSHFISPRDFLS